MDDLELVKQKINIVDLIQEYLPLKKSGINFKANCPFHQEKTPSFMVSPERQIFKCFGCFPPGELVKTPFGYHKIEGVDKNHWIISGKGELRRVTNTMVHHYNGSLISVTLRKLHRPVRLTSDHNVFVIRGAPYLHRQYKNFSRRYNKYLKIRTVDEKKYYHLLDKYLPIKKLPAGQLKRGDLLLYPIRRLEKDIKVIDLSIYLNHYPNHGKKPKKIPLRLPLNDNLLNLIGYWIAEGSNHRAYIRFSLGSHEKDFADEIVALIKKTFRLEAKIHKRNNIDKTGLEVTVCHSQLANIFENLCGKGAESKHIPFIFQDLPPTKQRILLEAIFKGDGYSFMAHLSPHLHKSITTVSSVLSEQLVDYILRMNLFPTLHVDKSHIDKLLVNHKQSYTVFWSEEAKQKYNLIYYQPDGSEYWLLPIINLGLEDYTGPVYNFTVGHDHSYVATNFAVANCQKGGDIFKFLMEKEGMDFREALETLAKKAGVALQKRKTSHKDPKDRLLEANLKAREFYHYLLTKHELGKPALNYLKKRGLSELSMKEFGLGYAPRSWESLTKFMLKRGFSDQELIASGLGVAARSGSYDRFRGRIIFSLVDHKGNIVGFSGRVLDQGEPKYINTPQTLIFDKSNFLYGLNLSKGEIKQKKEAILVEGEMDVILSHQAGVKNTVASKGTALTGNQVDLLKKYTDNINLCFDTDLAGDSAARRGIEIADQAGLNIKVIQVLEGKDPAELVLKNLDLWRELIQKAMPIYDYYLASVAKRYNLKDPAGVKGASGELIPIWAKISDDLERDMYIQKLSALLKTEESILRKLINSQRQTIFSAANYKQVLQGSAKDDMLRSPRGRQELLEEYLIALLLHIPKDHVFVPSFPETLLMQEPLRQIYVLLVLYLDSVSFKGRSFDINEFIKDVPTQVLGEVDRLYLIDLDAKLTDRRAWQKEVDAVVADLKKSLVKASLEKLSLEIKNAEGFGKIELLESLNRRFRDLSVKLKSL